MRGFARGRAAALAIAFLGAVASGCHRDEVTVYQIPKGSRNNTPLAASSAGDRDSTPGGNAGAADATHATELGYVLPAGWHEVTPGGMSVASFSMGEGNAELSIMSFPSAAISQLQMVNIVREKAGLPALSDGDLAKLVEPVAVGGEKGSMIDFTAVAKSAGDSKNPADKLALTIASHGNATWFFKVMGDAKAIDSQKPALIGFLKSIQFPEAAAAAPMAGQPDVAASGAPVASGGLPAMGSDAPADPADAANKPHWEVPKNWVEKPPTQMLLAKFSITDAGASADVTVSSFPGTVGGTLANVNRWRGSVGLEPIAEADLASAISSLDVPGGKAILTDMTGKSAKSGKDARLIGVIWPREGQTWFYKLLGDPAVAEREKEPLLKFVQSVRY